ncbi:NlpC/P60 family protein [Algoriphagus lacus]|uniref:NlpC/P60 family protein n=2 Tax=Algoriphagus lacus TaxID=2056311 RepID=A0A418PTA8_9BACT|nr:NlpC/P60 family protein [Algoriphagus lacus]
MPIGDLRPGRQVFVGGKLENRKMKFKKRRILKITAAIGVLTCAGIILAFGFSGEIESVPVSSEIAISTQPMDSTENHGALRDSLEDFGMDLLGVPYVYAGTSREGFDCSGFVYYVFKNFDIEVPRSSSQFDNFGKEISIDSVKKGDILVFLSPTRNAIGHIGIVTTPNGMETEFIHASSSKEMQVTISSLKQPGYSKRFVKAISVLEN